MDKRTRRDFLKTTGAGALGLGLGAATPRAEAAAESNAARWDGASMAQMAGGSGAGASGAGVGKLVSRGDPDYEATRLHMVWNQRVPARYPDAIAIVDSDQDVVDAVNLARARGLRVVGAVGGP